MSAFLAALKTFVMRRKWSVSFVVVLGIFFFFRFAHAETLGGAVDYIVLKLTELSQWLIQLLGDIILFLVSFLISIAKYNNFVHAYPVEIGWVLMRDIVNMFFIVILLMIAFGTIIGYEPLHYAKLLPKLLLMAVLINFSKTIIGLLIDLSQVVMLTFVSGFQAAAGGNFISALKLNSIQNLDLEDLREKVTKNDLTSEGLTGESQQSLQNIFIASALGLGMMVISVSIIAVMVIYFLVRIVGLWFLLIISPIAFFAKALPSNLQNLMADLTKNYWTYLTGFLTGGPIVAFFLWLSLATVQAEPPTGAGTSMDSRNIPGFESQSGSEEKLIAGQNVAISKVGRPEELAMYALAIIMLMMGLNTAIKTTSAVAPQALGIGKLAGAFAVGSAAYALRRGVGASAKVAGGLAVGGGRLINRKLDITESVGKIGLGVGRGIAGIGKGPGATGVGKVFGALMPTGMVGSAITRGSTKLASDAQERRQKAASELSGLVKNLNPEDRLKALEAMEYANTGIMGTGGIFGNKDFQNASVLQQASLRNTKPVQNLLKERYGEQFTQNNGKLREHFVNEYKSKNPGATDEQAAKHADQQMEVRSKAWAERQAKMEAARVNDRALKIVKDPDSRDFEMETKLTEETKKDPALYSKIDDLVKVAQMSMDDLKGLKADSFKYSGTSIATMKAIGAFDEVTGGMKAGYEDSDEWKELIKGGGDRAQYLQAHAYQLKNDAEFRNFARTQSLGMNATATDAEKQAGLAATYHISRSEDGRSMMFATDQANVVGPVGGRRTNLGGQRVERVYMSAIDPKAAGLIRSADEYLAPLDAAHVNDLRTAYQAAVPTRPGSVSFEDYMLSVAQEAQGPITTKQSEDLRDALTSGYIRSTGAPLTAPNASAATAERLVLSGLPQEAAFRMSADRRTYQAPAYQTAHQTVLSDTIMHNFTGPAADAKSRAEGWKKLLNVDVSLFSQISDSTNLVAENVAQTLQRSTFANLDNQTAIRALSTTQKKQFQDWLKGIQKAAQSAIDKRSSGVGLNPAETAVANLYETQLLTSTELIKLMNPKKKP